MRVVFMGTPDAAVPSLRALADAYDVVVVYTRVDKPRGRGQKTMPSPVKVEAGEREIEVVQPRSLKREAERLQVFEPDAIVVVAYGMILPPDVLAVPRLGCVNVHFSLLPRWRGAAPVERAILAGDAQTGVTTMLMDEGLDTGPILHQERTPITDTDTTGTVRDRLAAMGAPLVVQTVADLEAGNVEPRVQPSDGMTIAAKIEPGEAHLDPSLSAVELERRVRAFDPAPGAFLTIGSRRVKVWRARVIEGDGPPASIAAVGDEGIDVQTTQGRLRLTDVQPEGRRRMSAAEFVRGYRPAIGDSVG